MVVEWDEVQDVLVKHHNKLEHLFLHYAAADHTGVVSRGRAKFQKDVSSDTRTHTQKAFLRTCSNRPVYTGFALVLARVCFH